MYIDGTVSKTEGKPLRVDGTKFSQVNINRQFLQLCAEGRGPEKGDLLWLSIREPSFHFSFSDQAINIKSLNIERAQQFQLSLKI